MGIYIDAALNLMKEAGRRADIRRGQEKSDASKKLRQEEAASSGLPSDKSKAEVKAREDLAQTSSKLPDWAKATKKPGKSMLSREKVEPDMPSRLSKAEVAAKGDKTYSKLPKFMKDTKEPVESMLSRPPRPVTDPGVAKHLTGAEEQAREATETMHSKLPSFMTTPAKPRIQSALSGRPPVPPPVPSIPMHRSPAEVAAKTVTDQSPAKLPNWVKAPAKPPVQSMLTKADPALAAAPTAAPAAVVPPVVPPVATTGADPGFMQSPLGWAKRNPETALLGLAGAGALGGAGLYGLYNMYANNKQKERKDAQSGLNPGTLKAAMHKLGMTAMASPTAPSAAVPLPQPQQSGAMPTTQPNAPQQAQSSTSQPTVTTGQQASQQINNSWRQNAATNLQGGQQQQQGGQEQGGQEQSGQSQGQ
jgi:hypothetical protein